MAKNDVKKLWFEDFQLGKTKLKSRRWVVC